MSTDVRFELRRGTSGPWQQANPVLASGEPGVETDTGNMKVGDGVTQWNSLPYFTPTFYPDTNVISIGRDIEYAASIRIGRGAGSSQQSTIFHSVSLGADAGATGTGQHTVAIGSGAGRNGQEPGAIAIGFCSGSGRLGSSSTQGIGAVAIGRQAAQWGQGNYSIAIGQSAASVELGSSLYSQPDNSIVLNASGVPFAGPTGVTGGFYVSPIRSVPNTGNPLFLTSNNEIVVGVSSGSTGLSSISDRPTGPQGLQGVTGAQGPTGSSASEIIGGTGITLGSTGSTVIVSTLPQVKHTAYIDSTAQANFVLNSFPYIFSALDPSGFDWFRDTSNVSFVTGRTYFIHGSLGISNPGVTYGSHTIYLTTADSQPGVTLFYGPTADLLFPSSDMGAIIYNNGGGSPSVGGIITHSTVNPVNFSYSFTAKTYNTTLGFASQLVDFYNAGSKAGASIRVNQLRVLEFPFG